MSPRRDHLAEEAAERLLHLGECPNDASLRREAEDWAGRSPRHAEAWRAAETMWRLAGTVGPAAPFSLTARRRRGPSPGRLAGAALAACLVLAALPTLQLRSQADHITATGETRAVDLPDGTRVHLDSGSALAVDFSESRRGVALLSGQAFFEVTPNPERPFMVKAEEVEVTVTGTAFDVRLDRDTVTVEVQSGSVLTEYPPAAGGGGRVRLAPGDRLRVDRDGGGIETVPVATGQIAAWRRGRLLVEGATVGALVDEIRRYRTGLVIVAGNALAQRQVTGVFDLRDPLRALRTVVEPHSGKVLEITPWLVVISSD